MNLVIERAIAIAGSQKELALKVGVNQSAVSKWLCGGGIRSKYITALVGATDGQITAEEILSSFASDIESTDSAA